MHFNKFTTQEILRLNRDSCLEIYSEMTKMQYMSVYKKWNIYELKEYLQEERWMELVYSQVKDWGYQKFYNYILRKEVVYIDYYDALAESLRSESGVVDFASEPLRRVMAL